MSEQVNHPQHYGGEGNPYEAIKVIEAWGLDFPLGNAVKYISRAGKKDKETTVQDLEKAIWYIRRKIMNLNQLPHDLQGKGIELLVPGLYDKRVSEAK
jgi:hypothetical protein